MSMWNIGHAQLSAGHALVLISVVKADGSTPREVGATMLVTETAMAGSIGGGTLEWQAMAKAQALLQHKKDFEHMQFHLGPDLGQCCGGRVALTLERFTPARLEKYIEVANTAQNKPRQIFLCGAGHVGRALVLALAQAPFDIIWHDPRPNAFPKAIPANVTVVNDPASDAVFNSAHQGALAFILSHSHALDLSLVDQALRNDNIAATGLIGSATKRARFESRLLAANISPEKVSALICPIGVNSIRSKLPHAIAISTAAQILALDETLSNVEGKEHKSLNGLAMQS